MACFLPANYGKDSFVLDYWLGRKPELHIEDNDALRKNIKEAVKKALEAKDGIAATRIRLSSSKES